MMEQQKKAFLLLIGLSCLMSTVGAVPASRSLALRNQEPPLLPVADQVIMEDMPISEEEFIHGRMDIESNDYNGSGANNRHDPRTPGRQ